MPIAVLAVAGLLVLAACGGASSKPSAISSASNRSAQSIKFADCMRSHRVPKFRDPTLSAGGTFEFMASSSPAFKAAMKACAKLEPQGPGGNGPVPPSADTMRQWLAVAKCMRAHAVPKWPDPTPAPSGNPDAYGVVMESKNGVSLAISSSIDLQSPAVKQAAAACHVRLPA